MGYSAQELASVPEGANLGLGCGNPQAIAALKPGESVLDLGSGAGFDCLLAARQVGAALRQPPTWLFAVPALCYALNNNRASWNAVGVRLTRAAAQWRCTCRRRWTPPRSRCVGLRAAPCWATPIIMPR